MADTNKRVTFTGVDNGVESMMTRLRSSADQTTRDLIRQARDYSTSGKEVTKFIEEEIRAIEKRNQVHYRAQQLQAQQARASAQARGDEAGVAKAEAKIQQVAGDMRQDKLHLDMMRELIDTVKSTAREQIANDRRGVEETIDANENINQRGIAENADEMQELTQTIQREMIGDEAEAAGKSKKKYENRKKLEKGIQKGAQTATQDNEIYMLAATAAMIPFVGQGISMIAQKFMQKGEELERSAGGLYAVSGDYIGPQYDPDKQEFTKGAGYDKSYQYGMNQGEFLAQIMTPLARSVGAKGASEQEGMFALMAQAGLGVDMGSQAAYARLGRADRAFGLSNEQRTTSLIKAMQAAGMAGSGGKDMSLLPDLIQMQTQIGQAQLVRLGRIDTGINQALTTEIAGMSSIFKNPEVLSAVMTSLDQGLQSPSSSYAQAAQFAVLRQQNPGASRWELMKMQERGIQDRDQLQGILGRLRQASGANDELFFEQIKAFFPQLSLTQAEELGTGFIKRGGKLGGFRPAQGEGIDMESRAFDATGSLERRTANMDEWFARNGKKMNEYLDNKMKDFGVVVDEFKKGFWAGTDALGDFTSGLLDFQSKLQAANSNNGRIPPPGTGSGGSW